MRRPSISQIVYDATFPRPKPTDPTSFASHVTRNLVPEVRIETQTFYGSLDTIEAQYPGLDYSNSVHRMRLGRFPWHRKLFKTMDELGLTSAEIDSICRWEGTKSARENYEKEEGIVVRDTTGTEIQPDSRSGSPVCYIYDSWRSTFTQCNTVETQLPRSHLASSSRRYSARARPRSHEDPQAYLHHHSESEEEDEYSLQSYGNELNQRLLAATEARAQGVNVPIDEAYEQWLKEAAERGTYGDIVDTITTASTYAVNASRPETRGQNTTRQQTPARHTTSTSYGSPPPQQSMMPATRRHQVSTIPTASRRATTTLRPAMPSLRRR